MVLTVGTDSVRGSDSEHLCRPTGVAVANSGEFFVSDGYCNERVMKYSAAGEVLGEFQLRGAGVPHSIVLDDCLDLLYVADRENGLVRILSADDGTEHSMVDSLPGLPYAVTRDEYGNIYVLCWDRNNTAVLLDNAGKEGLSLETAGKVYAVQLLPRDPMLLQLQGKIEYDLNPIELPGVISPHDFAVTYNFAKNAVDMYVGETGPGPHGKVTLFSFELQ